MSHTIAPDYCRSTIDLPYCYYLRFSYAKRS